jgi:hypothetical protein
MVRAPSGTDLYGEGPMERSTLCARPDCASAATTLLSYDYGQGTVWLDDLVGAPDPFEYALCASHGDRLAVPVGWTREDRRGTATPLRRRRAAS